MDADLWAARLSAASAAAKRHHTHHHSQKHWDRLSIDDFEVEDDTRPEFSCPYCYEEFDISTLCSHLENEHLYESRGVVCPVCVAKVGKDLAGHITFQHGHLFKIQRRRRFRRTSIPSGATLSLLSKELREAHLQVLLGGFRSTSASSSNNADSFLSAFMQNLPTYEVEDSIKLSTSTEGGLQKVGSSSQQRKASSDALLSAEEREQKRKHETMRAKFVQQLVISTFMHDS